MAMGQLIEDANILYKKRKTLFKNINSQLDSLIVLLQDVGKRLGGKVVEPRMVNGDSTLPKVSSISLGPQDSSDGLTESISDELTVQELEAVREMAAIVKTLECHKRINKALREFNADLMFYDSELNLVSNAEYYNLIITNKTDEKLVCNMIGMHLLHYGLFDIYDQLRLEVIDLWGKNTRALVQSDIVVAYKRLHAFLDDISQCKCDEAIEWIKTVENASVVTKQRFELVLLDLFKIHFLGYLYTRDKCGEFKCCECELDDHKILQLQSFDIGTLWHKHGAQVGKLISQVLLKHNLPTPSEFKSLVNSALKSFRRVFCEHGVLIRKSRYHKLQVDVDREDAATAITATTGINTHGPDSQTASPCSTALAGISVSRQVTMGLGSTITAETIVHAVDASGAILPTTPSVGSRTNIDIPTSQTLLEDVLTPKTCYTMEQDSVSHSGDTIGEKEHPEHVEDEADLESACIHYPEAMYSWLEFLEDHLDLVKSDLMCDTPQVVVTRFEHHLIPKWLSQDHWYSRNALGYKQQQQQHQHGHQYVNIGYKSLEPSSLAMGSLAADVKLVVNNGDCSAGRLWYCRNVLACMLADPEAMCRLILPKGYNLENLPAVVMADACFNQAPVPRESGNRDLLGGASGATFRERQYHYRRFIRHGTTVFITTSDDLDDESFLHVSNMSRLLENYPFVRAVDDASATATGGGGTGVPSQALATTTGSTSTIRTGSVAAGGAGAGSGGGSQPPTFSLTLLTGSGSGAFTGQSGTSGRPSGVFSEESRLLANPSASRIRINFPNRSIEAGNNPTTGGAGVGATASVRLEGEGHAHSTGAAAHGSRGLVSPRSSTSLLSQVRRSEMPHSLLRPTIPGGDTPSAAAGLTPSSSAAASEVAAPISTGAAAAAAAVTSTSGGGGAAAAATSTATPSSSSSLNLRELLRLIVRGVRGESAQSPTVASRIGVSRRSPKAETATVETRSVIESPRSKLCPYAPSPLKFSESKYTNPDYVRVFLPCESPVNVVATAGLVTFPNLLSLLSVVCKDQCEASAKVETWIKTNQLPIESNLGPAFHFHSHFVCAVSKDETCAENLPMMLPCGHVICSVCIDRLAGKRRRRQFKCPLCPNVIEGSQVSLQLISCLKSPR